MKFTRELSDLQKNVRKSWIALSSLGQKADNDEDNITTNRITQHNSVSNFQGQALIETWKNALKVPREFPEMHYMVRVKQFSAGWPFG